MAWLDISSSRSVLREPGRISLCLANGNGAKPLPVSTTRASHLSAVRMTSTSLRCVDSRISTGFPLFTRSTEATTDPAQTNQLVSSQRNEYLSGYPNIRSHRPHAKSRILGHVLAIGSGWISHETDRRQPRRCHQSVVQR